MWREANDVNVPLRDQKPTMRVNISFDGARIVEESVKTILGAPERNGCRTQSSAFP
jgi:hypothetical protein